MREGLLILRRVLRAIARRIPGRALALELVPVHQLHVDRRGDAWECIAEGNDPRIDLRARPGYALPAPGWYQLRVAFELGEGGIVAPCLYPDYGEGQSEHSRIDVAEPARSGEYVYTVVLINAPVRALRFDPTQCAARFGMRGFRMRRISRLRAVLEMLTGIRRCAGESPRDRLGADLLGFLRHALREGAAAAAESLKQRYRGALRDQALSYQQWVARFDSRPAVEQTRDRVELRTGAPDLSVVLVVREPRLELLKRSIDSVLAQNYSRWQLCVVADVAASIATKRLLREYALCDRRICLQFSERCAQDEQAANEAIGLAKGDYLAFLGQEDELCADALRELARAVVERADARLLYSDEDKIDAAGLRSDPNFKPAWNPDLLRAQNYLCHLVAIRADLLREVGGLHAGYQGAQDHDLVLRCVERLRDEQIVHIPKILYHARRPSQATAAEPAVAACEAGRRAVEAHLARIGRPSRVEVTEHGYFRALPACEPQAPKVTVIVPTRDRAELLRTCVESVLDRTAYTNFELMVVDNGSVEPQAVDYLAGLRGRECVRVVDYPYEFNFSAIVNHAVAQSSAQVLCLLNNDTEVIGPDWLDELVSHAMREEVGAVGCMLYFPGDTIQHAGVILGIGEGGVAGHAHLNLRRGSGGYVGRARVVHNLTAVTGACLAVRRSVYDEVGGMDENLAVAFNDIDLCLRIDANGYRNVWTPFAELYHHESASRGQDNTPEKRARFLAESDTMLRRWGDLLRNDPAYNPNLSLDSPNFELAFPPRTTISRTSRGGRMTVLPKVAS